MKDRERCPWPAFSDPLYLAGLSWSTILHKRENYRRAFAGSTIVYAHMQAVGMANDHLVTCYRYRELTG